MAYMWRLFEKIDYRYVWELLTKFDGDRNNNVITKAIKGPNQVKLYKFDI